MYLGQTIKKGETRRLGKQPKQQRNQRAEARVNFRQRLAWYDIISQLRHFAAEVCYIVNLHSGRVLDCLILLAWMLHGYQSCRVCPVLNHWTFLVLIKPYHRILLRHESWCKSTASMQLEGQDCEPGQVYLCGKRLHIWMCTHTKDLQCRWTHRNDTKRLGGKKLFRQWNCATFDQSQQKYVWVAFKEMSCKNERSALFGIPESLRLSILCSDNLPNSVCLALGLLFENPWPPAQRNHKWILA